MCVGGVTRVWKEERVCVCVCGRNDACGRSKACVGGVTCMGGCGDVCVWVR